MACVYFLNFQPKSLHACPPPVPPPSSAMLKAIREASIKPKNAAETAVKSNNQQRVNKALTLKKDPQESHSRWERNNSYSSYPTPVYASYPRRSSSSSDIQSNWPASSGISNVTSLGSLEVSTSEPGMGSIRDKVVALKEALREATERQSKAKEGIPAANKRFQDAKKLLAKLERKRFIAEDKVVKLEERIRYQEGRLNSKYRAMSENWQVNHKIEQKKSEDLRNIRNIEYELTEVKAAREASVKRVHDATRRAVLVQSSLQKADDRKRELVTRKRSLQEMLEMYHKRIRELKSKAREKSAQVESKFLRMNLIEDYIADRKDRFARAERRLLPLKIYINQLHDSLDQVRNETRHAEYILANFQQRLKGQKYTYYPYDK